MNHLNRSAAEGPQLRTLLLTDLVDSTGLVERLGDTAAAAADVRQFPDGPRADAMT